MTRGGPALYTCDFIADTAVEALGYVVEIFGKEDVQRVMSRDMGLEFRVDDECALRSIVCGIMCEYQILYHAWGQLFFCT